MSAWIDNEVFDLVDMRKTKVRNFVAGRWVLTVKKDKDGNFQKCKARWVLKGFQDKQKNTQRTDRPAASRAGFRCATQIAANFGWDLFHLVLKTAFLQGEAYDGSRDIICQISPGYGYPPYIGARLKKPGYGLNDAPRRWWQIIDKALLDCGLGPTRADRCTYILYDDTSRTRSYQPLKNVTTDQVTISEAMSILWILLHATMPRDAEHTALYVYMSMTCLWQEITFLIKGVIQSALEFCGWF